MAESTSGVTMRPADQQCGAGKHAIDAAESAEDDATERDCGEIEIERRLA
ncbi:MAG: hypothetical protein U0744_09110 [Gemmataceae bacterium]